MSRPQRNRRFSRRVWSPVHNIHNRPVKRLFTPEIKRILKDWLVRRRANPYPSRDEKKFLAMETGLTYTQICNWFANWRRKLKNSERQRAPNSWGTLIKNYNTNARGNVEQFSISSEDSIWEEDVDEGLSVDDEEYREENPNNKHKQGYEQYYELPYRVYEPNIYTQTVKMENRNYYSDDDNNNNNNNNNGDVTAQCFQITSTTADDLHEISTNPATSLLELSSPSLNKTKYKQIMMEKYLRDTFAQDEKKQNDTLNVEIPPPDLSGAAELSKWLESAAKFTPNKHNYFVEWNERNKSAKRLNRRPALNGFHIYTSQQTSLPTRYTSIHKDELDAAEALTSLALNCRQRMLDSTKIHTPANAISS